MATPEERFTFESGTARGPVTGAWADPGRAAAALVVAPGAGSDLDAPFLVGFTRALNDAGIATMRFNFPYKESGRKAPDPEATLRATWLAAFDAAAERAGAGVPVFAGGKSMGGRHASMCAADGMAAAGLVFLGYPLHAPGRPEKVRDAHLYGIEAPMLFIEGTRDPFVTPLDQLEGILAKLGDRAVLHEIPGGDHSFRVKGQKRDDREIGAELAPVAADFMRAHR
ncbi:MAG: alpha/beta family hydrolase [Actinomycetota bacterium]